MAERPDPNLVAASFAGVIRGWLMDTEWTEMRRLNATPEFATGCCASHNYCDANMAMDQAFGLYGYHARPSSDEDTRLWNECWEIAKHKYLTVATGQSAPLTVGVVDDDDAPKLALVTDILDGLGLTADWEWPGYICVRIDESRTASIADNGAEGEELGIQFDHIEDGANIGDAYDTDVLDVTIDNTPVEIAASIMEKLKGY